MTFQFFCAHPIFPSDEMQLICNEKVHILDILTLLPPPREHIPILRRTHYHIALWIMAITQHIIITPWKLQV